MCVCVRVCVSALSWESFSGVRVLSVPGDVSYAANHGVYLCDQQVLLLPLVYYVFPVFILSW